jgi:ABC-2 type transport system ATP-binding protein
LLKIENATKSYAKKGAPAVDRLSLRVKAGEIYGFIGPNGAGKTTTIKMACGILSLDAGSVCVGEIDMASSPLEAKRLLSYVPDSPDIPQKLKGSEYLSFVADMHEVPRRERGERIQKFAALFDLEGNLGERVSSYSHGMRQKLSLVAALLNAPRLIVLDEPMVGLDPKSSHNLKELMRSLCREGAAVFFSTHVLDVAERFCDRVGIINHGRLIAEGTLEALRAGKGERESLEEIFLELTDG